MRLEAALLVSFQSPSALADLDDGLAGLEEAFVGPVVLLLAGVGLVGARAEPAAGCGGEHEGGGEQRFEVADHGLVGNGVGREGRIATFNAASVGGSRTERLPVTLRIPDDAVPGRHNGEVTLTYTAGARKYDLTDVVPITVDSGVQVGTITRHRDPATRLDGPRRTCR